MVWCQWSFFDCSGGQTNALFVALRAAVKHLGVKIAAERSGGGPVTQPATEIDQLQLTFFVFQNESGYIFSW